MDWVVKPKDRQELDVGPNRNKQVISLVASPTEPSDPRILVVDDEKVIRTVFSLALRKWSYQVDIAADAETALEMMREMHYQLVLSDISMPGHDGIWLLSQISDWPDKPLFIIMTGNADLDVAIHCLTSGAHDFLVKPVELDYLKRKVEDALALWQLDHERRRQQDLLEEVAITERWKAQQLFLNAIDALILALEAKDPYTEGHSSRVAAMVEGMARQANFRSHDVVNIVNAARCHDVGKIGWPDAILLKDGKLTDEEYERVKTHPEKGEHILAPIFKDYPDILDGVRHHHERFDGKGYPSGLKGETIPLFARMITVADSFDAMTSTRTYRKARSSGEAVNEIIACSGKQFCPQVVRYFLNFYNESLAGNEERNWIDRRRQPRYEKRAQVKLRQNDIKFDGRSLDFSTQGLQVEVDGQLQVQHGVNVHIAAGRSLDAWVKWSEDDDNGGCLAGLSIRAQQDDYLELLRKHSLTLTEQRGSHRLSEVITAEIMTDAGIDRHNILNLSSAGAFIQTRRALPIDAELVVRFRLEGEVRGLVQARGVVVHQVSMQEAIMTEGIIPGMGVQFMEFVDDSQARLAAYIQSKILRRNVSRLDVSQTESPEKDKRENAG